MNRLLRVALFLVSFYAGALSAQTSQQLTDPGYNPGLLEHIVLFRFTATTTTAQKSEVIDSFMALKSKSVRNGAPYINSIENGMINNPAIGSHHDFELAFVVRFKSEGDRNFYVGKPFITDPQFFDPAHERFKNFVGPFLEPGTCGTNTAFGAFVFDFKDKQLPPEGDSLSLTSCGQVFKYVSLTSPSGKTWLDRNLGASRVALTATDFSSYGSLYQWGRGSDGHQCINWTNDSIGAPFFGSTATLSIGDSPINALFILSLSTLDWRATTNNNLWQGVTGINNPCPSGYRVPTRAEWEAEIPFFIGGNPFNSVLRLPLSGDRDIYGLVTAAGKLTYLWSSTIDPATGKANTVISSGTSTSVAGSVIKTFGFGVRCIRN